MFSMPIESRNKTKRVEWNKISIVLSRTISAAVQEIDHKHNAGIRKKQN